MDEFSTWDIARSLILAAEWTVVLALVAFVLGGTVKGGKVYGKWPGLGNEQLNEGRDLAVTTDFRNVLGEAAYCTLGSRSLDVVFPGAKLSPANFLNFA